jgi:hypothetical protein
VLSPSTGSTVDEMRNMTREGDVPTLLTQRRHIDLLRTSSDLCRA